MVLISFTVVGFLMCILAILIVALVRIDNKIYKLKERLYYEQVSKKAEQLENLAEELRKDFNKHRQDEQNQYFGEELL